MKKRKRIRRTKSYTYKNITYPSVKSLADFLGIIPSTLQTKITRCGERGKEVFYNDELIKIITY